MYVRVIYVRTCQCRGTPSFQVTFKWIPVCGSICTSDMQSMHCMFKCRYNSSSVQSRQLVIYRVVLCVCVVKYQCYCYCCHLNNTPWPFLCTITPCCPPKALCVLSSIQQLLFGWLVGPVRLRDVQKCTSVESGEQFVVTVGTHWTAKWSVSSSATRE